MISNFDFKNLVGGDKRPFKGYSSAIDKTIASGRLMVRGSKNVYVKDSGTIANRPGLKRRGAADATEAGIKSSFEWVMSLGFTRPLRVVNGELQVESDIAENGTYVWYTLLDSLTRTRFNFAPWWDNTAKKDLLIMCDGADDLRTWSGALGIFDQGNSTSNTIALTATAASLGFRSSGGTVIINGTEYTYTGTSASTLTGVGSDPTGEADGSVVIDKPDIVSDTPAANFEIDFIKVINNQLYCGSDSSRLIYISDDADYTDFTPASPRVPGDADLLTLDEIPTGIASRQGKAHISTLDSWYVVSFDQITVGSTLTERSNVQKIPMAGLKGAKAHEFIDNVGDDIVYLSADQQLTVFGTFRNINQPQFPTLSEGIKEELANEDVTGGHLRAIGDFVYITAPNNGRVWLHETRTRVNALGNITQERIWHSPFIWNIARIALISGVEYGHSNANPQLYQMWNTLQWHDDSPSDEDIPYDSVLALAYQQYGKRGEYHTFDKVYYEGYIAAGSDLQSAVVFEYQGSNTVQLVTINSIDNPTQLFTGDVGISLGDASLGDNPLGDKTTDEELEQELLPKFRAIGTINAQNAFESQLRVFSSEANSRWEILAIGPNVQNTQTKPVFIKK